MGEDISNDVAHILPTSGAANRRIMTADVAEDPTFCSALTDPKSLLVSDFGGLWRFLSSMHPRGLEPLTLSSED